MSPGRRLGVFPDERRAIYFGFPAEGCPFSPGPLFGGNLFYPTSTGGPRRCFFIVLLKEAPFAWVNFNQNSKDRLFVRRDVFAGSLRE